MSAEEIRERIATAEVPPKDLSLEERLERTERALVTLCEIVDEFAGDFKAMIERADRVLKQAEEEGPGAFLAALMSRRRRRG